MPYRHDPPPPSGPSAHRVHQVGEEAQVDGRVGRGGAGAVGGVATERDPVQRGEVGDRGGLHLAVAPPTETQTNQRGR